MGKEAPHVRPHLQLHGATPTAPLLQPAGGVNLTKIDISHGIAQLAPLEAAMAQHARQAAGRLPLAGGQR